MITLEDVRNKVIGLGYRWSDPLNFHPLMQDAFRGIPNDHQIFNWSWDLQNGDDYEGSLDIYPNTEMAEYSLSHIEYGEEAANKYGKWDEVILNAWPMVNHDWPNL